MYVFDDKIFSDTTSTMGDDVREHGHKVGARSVPVDLDGECGRAQQGTKSTRPM